jgi:hypothetical protein
VLSNGGLVFVAVVASHGLQVGAGSVFLVVYGFGLLSFDVDVLVGHLVLVTSASQVL